MFEPIRPAFKEMIIQGRNSRKAMVNKDILGSSNMS